MSIAQTEKQFQKYIADYLVKENGYIEHTDQDFNCAYAFDNSLLLQFLYTTQKEKMQKLEKMYKNDATDRVLAAINAEITKKSSSLIYCLKHGVDVGNEHLDLMYTKPATTFNKKEWERYEQNLFSVIQEVNADVDKKERVDLVLFLNGIAIISVELKCNNSGQSYKDAIYQYRFERNPEKRLFLFKAGCLVHFAMDLDYVTMTTRLCGGASYFLPFNQGKTSVYNLKNGESIVETGDGNENREDGKFPTCYMWEDIWTKDTILELISRFIFVERTAKKEKGSKKGTISENLIFPRYHQLRFLRKAESHIVDNLSNCNYLVQHSAGSGKTNTIAWLSHRLSTLHDSNEKQIFDTIIVVTDRCVVDNQLQKAVLSLDHTDGLIRVMDEDCTSKDLESAINNGIKIIATTIQKFPNIKDSVKKFSSKRFAVIIDEAHSSTNGRNMEALVKSLNNVERVEEDSVDAIDIIENELDQTGKAANVSMFAFTATPKHSTLQKFGTLNANGKKEAFDLYSMKQAIEEGFILNVLDNYIEYKTLYKIHKLIKDDPALNSAEAKKKIHKMAMLEKTNIQQRTAIIIEHFRNTVLGTCLEGQEKAMVITASRKEAVEYKQAFDKYIKENNYTDMQTLVAFSGKVKLADGKEYTEAGMNNNLDNGTIKITEDNLPEIYDENESYKVLLVANKYQTGFDQKKLCAMYVMKSLNGIAAVQTLSRLNRICPPYEKKTYIVDFSNTIKDIQDSFAPYYSRTILENPVSLEQLKEVEMEIRGYNVLDFNDIDEAIEKTLEKKNAEALVSAKLNKVKIKIKQFDDDTQAEIKTKIKRYVKYYSFLAQIVPLQSTEMHKLYLFLSWLLPYLKEGRGRTGFDLKNKIKIDTFNQKKEREISNPKINPKPGIKSPDPTTPVQVVDLREKLSEIIKKMNEALGVEVDVDMASNSAMGVKEILEKDDELKESALHNSRDNFTEAYYDHLDNALIQGNADTKQFFNLLLNNEGLKKEIMGIFIDEMYHKFRGDEEK